MAINFQTTLVNESQLHMIRILIQAEVKYAIERERGDDVSDQREICDTIFLNLLESMS
jgi:hypothetical protein